MFLKLQNWNQLTNTSQFRLPCQPQEQLRPRRPRRARLQAPRIRVPADTFEEDEEADNMGGIDEQDE
jgi:hypothetical protein